MLVKNLVSSAAPTSMAPSLASELRRAAAEGSTSRLERLLADCDDAADVASSHDAPSCLERRRCGTPTFLRSLVHLAGFHDHPEAAGFLFQRAALASSGVETRRGFGSSESDKLVARLKLRCAEMIDASRRGDVETVRTLLQQDAMLADSVDDTTGETAFAAAFASGRRQLCESLLEHGAGAVGVCLPTKSTRCSPVKLAVTQQNIPLVRWLLDLGANPASRVDGKQNALSLAAYDGDPAMVEMLLASGAKLDEHHCSWIALPPPLDSSVWGLDEGEERDFHDEEDEDRRSKLQDQTPFLLLGIASLRRHRRLIRFLFATRPELKDSTLLTLYGNIALVLAVCEKAEDILTELLRNGVSFQSRIESSNHPVYAAVVVDSVRLLRLLRNTNAVQDLPLLVTLSALHGSVECLEELLDCDLIPKVGPSLIVALFASLEKRQTAAAIVLIKRLSVPNQASRCLSFAIDRNDGELIELLLARSIVSSAVLQQHFNEACLSGSEGAVAQLLAHGVDVNAPITGGSTYILHQVLQKIGRGRAYVHIARLLLESGACIDLLDSLGETAFEVVSRRGLYIRTPASAKDLRDVKALLLKYSNSSWTGNPVAIW